MKTKRCKKCGSKLGPLDLMAGHICISEDTIQNNPFIRKLIKKIERLEARLGEKCGVSE